jgi:hypothetical protein
MPGKCKIPYSQLGLLFRERERTGRKSAVVRGTLDKWLKIVIGSAALACAKVDPDFRRKLQLDLEKELAPEDRWVLRNLMQKWGVAVPPSLSLAAHVSCTRGPHGVFDLRPPVD